MGQLHLSTLVLSALALGLSACTYDTDPLFEHSVVDAGAVADSGPAAIVTDALIGAWVGNDSLVDQDCVSCAEAKCADAEGSCRGDPECVAYTNCVGASPSPAGQAACREQHMAWVRSDVRAHDLDGPYGSCVFKFNCAVECSGNDDLQCLNKFSWPSTSAASVPLHLYLADATNPTSAVSGVKVKVCAGTDVLCGRADSPGAQGTTDATGMVELSLPTTYVGAFTGYLDVQGGGLYPSLVKFSWNIGQETSYLLNSVNKDLFTMSIGAIGLMPDEKRGMLQMRALGCGGIGLRGASFASDKADGQSQTWYIDILPKLNLTSTGTVGSGGIIDVPEGNTTVTATRASDNVLIAKTDAPVRAGFMTIIVMEPAPQ